MNSVLFVEVAENAMLAMMEYPIVLNVGEVENLVRNLIQIPEKKSVHIVMELDAIKRIAMNVMVPENVVRIVTIAMGKELLLEKIREKRSNLPNKEDVQN